MAHANKPRGYRKVSRRGEAVNEKAGLFAENVRLSSNKGYDGNVRKGHQRAGWKKEHFRLLELKRKVYPLTPHAYGGVLGVIL